MRKEKSRDAARSRRSKENHEFYELAKLLPLPAAITSQLDFLDKASIIRLTISFLKLRQFSVNGHPPWAPDFTTLGSVNPYSAQSQSAGYNGDSSRPTSAASNQLATGTSSSGYQRAADATFAAPAENPYSNQHPLNVLNDRTKNANLFDIHQGTHILQSLDGFAFAISRDGRFLYISETVSMYLGLSQVEMTGSSVFDYTHQQDHEELARQLGIPYASIGSMNSYQDSLNAATLNANSCDSPAPNSVRSQYSAASQDTTIDDHVNASSPKKKFKAASQRTAAAKRQASKAARTSVKLEPQVQQINIPVENHHDKDDLLDINDEVKVDGGLAEDQFGNQGTKEDPLVRQFCIRMKSTLTKRGCQHFKSSGYRVVHVVAHLRTYQSNDHGHLMDPLDEAITAGDNSAATGTTSSAKQMKRRGPKATQTKQEPSDKTTGAAKQNSDSNNNLQATSNSNRPPATTSGKTKIIGLVAVAIALPPPSINELRLESDTFVFRLSLDLKVTHIEPKVSELLHYPVESIVGRSLYALVHPADVHQVQRCHRDLLRKGQMMSGYYRLMSRSGGYIWVQTCATLICNNNPLAGAQVAPAAALGPPDEPIQPGQSCSAGGKFLQQPNSYAAATHMELGHYNQSFSHHQTKTIASPSVSSHLSAGSQFEAQDQDQCVIFVNYMITDVIEREEINDICQSEVGQAATTTVHYNSSSNSSSLIISGPPQQPAANAFHSPASSCSSPCLASLKATGGANLGYMTPPLSSPSHQRAAPLHRNSNTPSESHHQHHKRQTGHRIGRPAAKSSGKSSQILYHNSQHNHELAADSNGLGGQKVGYVDSAGSMYYGGHEPQATADSATGNGMNLALNSVVAARSSGTYGQHQAAGESAASSWPTASSHPNSATLGDAVQLYPMPTGGGGDGGAQDTSQHSSRHQSIYKAAFGFADAAAATAAAVAAAATGSYAPTTHMQPQPTQQQQQAHHPHQHVDHQQAQYSTSGPTQHQQAATGYNSNTSQQAANPYAHLEAAHPATNHHHHQQAAAAAYYNYYGYYGNKFI